MWCGVNDDDDNDVCHICAKEFSDSKTVIDKMSISNFNEIAPKFIYSQIS